MQQLMDVIMVNDEQPTVGISFIALTQLTQ